MKREATASDRFAGGVGSVSDMAQSTEAAESQPESPGAAQTSGAGQASVAAESSRAAQASLAAHGPVAGGSTPFWDQILDRARGSMSEQGFTTWLTSVAPVSWARGTLRLEAPSRFHAEWLEDKYGALIREIADDIAGSEVRLDITSKDAGAERAQPQVTVAPVVAPPPDGLGEDGRPAGSMFRSVGMDGASAYHAGTSTTGPTVDTPADPSDMGIKAKYTFDRFVVGQNNQLAQAASRAVAENPGRSYNPLFIYGSTGLGKTHLMHAIANRSRTLENSARVGYVSAEKFLNDMVAAMGDNSNDAFRARYRSYDLLLVDDVQFMRRKERTQEEFFHTFNVLYHGNRQIVLSSDRHPKDLDGLEERLVSRFEWGLVTGIAAPDYETRVAIVRRKAEEQGVDLSLDVLDLIARHCTASVRQLEGAIIKVLAFASLTGREVTMGLTRRALTSAGGTAPQMGSDIIVARVAAAWKVKAVDLASKKRARGVVVPRQVAMFLLRGLLEMSLAKIGRVLGGRDHSTVIHSIRKVEARMRREPEFRQRVEALQDAIENPQ